MPLSALHQVDVFDRDRAAIAVVGDQNGEADGGFGGRYGQHHQREHLAHQIAEKGGEGDEIDVDREQDQLDRHQNDDDVLPVYEDPEDTDREQDGGHREVMAEADGHIVPLRASYRPWPGRTLTMSIAVALVRATCSAMFCRLTLGLWRSVNTIAPIIAPSSTTPQAWKKKHYAVSTTSPTP